MYYQTLNLSISYLLILIFLQINAGVAEVDGDGRKLKIRRSSLLLVEEVRKNYSHLAVKDKEIAKQLADNKHLREIGHCGCILLYQDFDQVLYLPGTDSSFSVEKYKESIGRAYSRVNLYLCRLNDYESKHCTYVR